MHKWPWAPKKCWPPQIWTFKWTKSVGIHCIHERSPVAMTNTSIYLGNHPFPLKEEGRRLRDVSAEVRMMCASSWLLHFIHWVSGRLPLNKSSSRRKDFELQCCISNDNFLPVPISHAFPRSLSLSLSFSAAAERCCVQPISLFQVSITWPK